jgi:HD domain
VNDDDLKVGTATWVQQTSGWLTPADRRALLLPLARGHLSNAVGRLRLLLRLHPGRNAYVPRGRMVPPDTALTRAARDHAVRVLSVALLNHSYRTYHFGRALGELEGLDVDAELLFAAAMLHDTGLIIPPGDADFTLASSRLARDVAEQVGLSTAASEVMQTAITLHYSPSVDLSAGPVAYLLSAGAAVDVIGLRSWELPADTLTDAVRQHPRAGFKTEFTAAFRREAARVPQGRAKLLHRYGAFAAAIRFAPFDE